MRKTREQSRQETRQRLIAAGQAAIVREGIRALSLRGVCEEAGYSQGAFYSNFSSRDELLLTIMELHRHEVDYRGNVREGDEISAVTWISGTPRGARYVRRTEFHDSNGRAIVTALTHWAMVDRETGKLVRVRAEMAAPFVCNDELSGVSAHGTD